MDAVECHIAAARNPAFRLALWTGVEIAQPPEIPFAPWLKQEYVRLMAGNAAAAAAKAQQRPVLRPAHPVEPPARFEPDGEVQILALMPDLNPGAAVRAEARHLLEKRLGD